MFTCVLRKVNHGMEKKTLNIVFVGNSYTYYNQMPQMAFTQLAEAEGYKVIVWMIFVNFAEQFGKLMKFITAFG